MLSGLSVASFSEANRFLWGRLNFEKTAKIPYRKPPFYLDRMLTLCDLIGNPQRQVPAVHVAGTKGKGSTSTMLANILQSAGYTTGLYTSPHISDVRERIGVGGHPISVDDFVARFNEVLPAVIRLDLEFAPCGPTYFEILTAMALLHFGGRVQIAVLEVGLGGRLDSTNVCQPVCCAVTNISLDHTRQLGRTLSAIAGEKAGIVKPGVPVVSGETGRAAKRVIENCAKVAGAPLLSAGRDYRFESRKVGHHADRMEWRMDYHGPNGKQWSDIRLGMLGQHQHANAALALTVCGVLSQQGWPLSDEHCRRGLESARAPARLELIQQRPFVILDTAHNAASMAATVQGLRDYWPTQRLVFVVATTRGKDVAAILRHILSVADTVILTKYLSNPRGHSIDDLQHALRRVLVNEPFPGRILPIPDPREALRAAYLEAGVDDVICVTGSFFLATDLMPVLSDQPTPPEVEGT